MEAKEKAKELVNKYGSIVLGENIYGEPFTMAQENLQEAKQCALIAVDELIKNSYFINELISLRFKGSLFINPLTESKEYWQEVIQEIEKL